MMCLTTMANDVLFLGTLPLVKIFLFNVAKTPKRKLQKVGGVTYLSDTMPMVVSVSSFTDHLGTIVRNYVKDIPPLNICTALTSH